MSTVPATEPHPGHRRGAPTTVLLQGVGKDYRVGPATVTALAGADLEVDEGEFVVVLGPSGSGKTTLLNIIGALDTPSRGQVTVAGRDISGATRRQLFAFRRDCVSFVFQSFNLFPSLTALENVQFAIDVAGRRRDKDDVAGRRRGKDDVAGRRRGKDDVAGRRRGKDDVAGRRRQHEDAAGVLARVGLGDRLAHFPHELSGGEQQRVAIARALATGNPVLLADEPTGELDFRTGVQILELLQAQTTTGRTVLVVTHNREIARIADRVVELSSGRIAGDGPPPGGRAPVSQLHW